MRAIGNFLWFILGGVLMGLAWWFVGLVAFITIIGIPWGKACFVIGQFTFFPFGKEAISRKELKQKDDIGTGGLGVLGNIIWFIFAGFWLAIGHVVSALINFISIIGIPFGLQHLKLAGIALAPIGKTIVTKEVAAAARKALPPPRWPCCPSPKKSISTSTGTRKSKSSPCAPAGPAGKTSTRLNRLCGWSIGKLKYPCPCATKNRNTRTAPRPGAFSRLACMTTT